MVKAYETRLEQMLAMPVPLVSGKPNELSPRELRISPAAKREWFAFADAVERQMAPKGDYKIDPGSGQ